MQQQAQNRNNISNGRRFNIVLKLQEMVNTHNKSFKYALENAPSVDFNILIDADKRPMGEHARRYNAPGCNEIAVIMAGDIHGKRDIVLKCRDTNQSLKRI